MGIEDLKKAKPEVKAETKTVKSSVVLKAAKHNITCPYSKVRVATNSPTIIDKAEISNYLQCQIDAGYIEVIEV